MITYLPSHQSPASLSDTQNSPCVICTSCIICRPANNGFGGCDNGLRPYPSDEFDFLDYGDYQIGLSGTVLNDIGWDLRVHELSDGGNETVVFTISQSFGG